MSFSDELGARKITMFSLGYFDLFINHRGWLPTVLESLPGIEMEAAGSDGRFF